MPDIGERLIFGSYPQNNADLLVKEPIEWVILDKKEDRFLCISRYLLDCRAYHPVSQMVNWATCALREWLNREFVQAAFTLEEQQRILTTHLINGEDCPQYDTWDKVFLLDDREAVDYFESEEHPMTRSAVTTAYTRSRGAWFLSPEEAGEDVELIYAGSWLLRTPGYIPDDNPVGLFDTLSCVNFDDYIEDYACGVETGNNCIRPALWLKRE